jgi:hypothetical protein
VKGVAVGCLDRDGAAAAETARRIEGSGAKSIAVTGDVTDERTIAPAIDRIVRALGSLEALVNCAGITGKTNVKAHEVDLADFDVRLSHQPPRGAGGRAGRAAAHAGAELRPYSPRRLDRRQGRQCRHGGLFRKQGGA